DIQLHYLSLYKCGEIMRKIAEVGITTREACGNTVRNVTGCARAGVCQNELFDVTPYASSVSKYLLRNPVCQSMPRKFKISFSGCPSDCALPGIHDIGLIAAKKILADKSEIQGFKVFAGGGLGSMPRMAHLLEEFITTTELNRVCEAVVRVFDRFGNRKNRNRARLKFVIEKLGMTQFNKLYREEYEKLKTRADAELQIPAVLDGRPQDLLAYSNGNGEPSTNGHSETVPMPETDPYGYWLRTNVEKQKQPGFSMVQIRLVLGDIHASAVLKLAEIVKTYAGGHLRITINQNFLLRWVKNSALPALYGALKTADLEKAGAETIGDVVACPGADTCGIAITASKQMANALTGVFGNGLGSAPDLDGVKIKISGCQNSCAQHHLAPIGLHGVSKRVGDHVAPFYELHLGGHTASDGTSVGKIIAKIPSKNVPEAVKKVVAIYRKNRGEEESFLQFTDRFGKKEFADELSELAKIPLFEDSPQYYYDWGATREFEMVDLGAGECAGGADTMIKNSFEEADIDLALAKELNGQEQGAFAVSKAHRALVAGIKGMLFLKGIEPSTDTEAFLSFDEHYIKKGTLKEKFPDFKQFVEKLEVGGHPSSSAVAQDIARVGTFLEACRIVFALSDTENNKPALSKTGSAEESEDAKATRQLEQAKIEAVAEAEKIKEIAPTAKMDLRGVKCPINFVKTKIKLEMMDSGDILEVLLDEGEPADNVPRSVKDEGHQILNLSQTGNYFKLVIKKL
ncbi:MAG: sulfurtransferase TusA family protein, partial [Nitrospirae bacterium]|nr:sulfurtransferase TusA family protein [Nitrospirota bacterium]